MSSTDSDRPSRVDHPVATPLPIARKESRQAFTKHVARGWAALTHQPIGTRLVLAWKLIWRKKLEGSLAMLRQRTCPITAALLSDERLRERESTYRDRRRAKAAALADQSETPSATSSSTSSATSSRKAEGSAGPKNTSP